MLAVLARLVDAAASSRRAAHSRASKQSNCCRPSVEGSRSAARRRIDSSSGSRELGLSQEAACVAVGQPPNAWLWQTSNRPGAVATLSSTHRQSMGLTIRRGPDGLPIFSFEDAPVQKARTPPVRPQRKIPPLLLSLIHI